MLLFNYTVWERHLRWVWSGGVGPIGSSPVLPQTHSFLPGRMLSSSPSSSSSEEEDDEDEDDEEDEEEEEEVGEGRDGRGGRGCFLGRPRRFLQEREGKKSLSVQVQSMSFKYSPCQRKRLIYISIVLRPIEAAHTQIIAKTMDHGTHFKLIGHISSTPALSPAKLTRPYQPVLWLLALIYQLTA